MRSEPTLGPSSSSSGSFRAVRPWQLLLKRKRPRSAVLRRVDYRTVGKVVAPAACQYRLDSIAQTTAATPPATANGATSLNQWRSSGPGPKRPTPKMVPKNSKETTAPIAADLNTSARVDDADQRVISAPVTRAGRTPSIHPIRSMELDSSKMRSLRTGRPLAASIKGSMT